MNVLLRSNRSATLNYSTDFTAGSVSRFVTRRPALTASPADEAAQSLVTRPLNVDTLYPSLYAEPVSRTSRPGAYLAALALELTARLRARDARAGIAPGSKRQPT